MEKIKERRRIKLERIRKAAKDIDRFQKWTDLEVKAVEMFVKPVMEAYLILETNQAKIHSESHNC